MYLIQLNKIIVPLILDSNHEVSNITFMVGTIILAAVEDQSPKFYNERDIRYNIDE